MNNEPDWWIRSLTNIPNQWYKDITTLSPVLQRTWTQVHRVLVATNDDNFVQWVDIWNPRSHSNVIPFPTNELPISQRFHQWALLSSAAQQDIESIYELYLSLEYLGQLRPRSREYVTENIDNFITVKVEGKIVGCVEIINIDDRTIELGGIAVAMDAQKMNIGLQLIDTVERYAYTRGLTILSVTGYDRLAHMYEQRGYTLREEWKYDERAQQSPNKAMYIKIPNLDNVVRMHQSSYSEFEAKLA